MERSTQKSLLLALAGLGLLAGIRMMVAESNRYDLRGRVAIITGGSRGLGLVLARHLAARGVKLVICSRTEDQLEAAYRELTALGADVLALPCDVTNKSEVRDLVDAAIDRFGKIDILINNAGVIQVGPIDVMTERDYEEAMNTHFWAPLYTTLTVLPFFRSRQEGRIINITSIGGKIAVPHLLPYSASKFALMGFSEGIAAELQKENILVSTIVPGLMRTGSTRNITVKGDHEKEYAWFKTAASLPVLSEQPANVARKVIDALEYNCRRPVVSRAERLASITKEIAPEGLGNILSWIDRLLPRNSTDGFVSKKGYESESSLSGSKIGRRADEDARLNNEM